MQLTKKENEICTMVLEYPDKKQLAEYFCVTYATIRTHLKRIYPKFKVNSMPELVAAIAKEKIADVMNSNGQLKEDFTRLINTCLKEEVPYRPTNDWILITIFEAINKRDKEIKRLCRKLKEKQKQWERLTQNAE